MTPTNLNIGASRLELLNDGALRIFADKSWLHLGDADTRTFGIRGMFRRLKLARRGLDPKAIKALYEKTNFQPFHYAKGDSLPIADQSVEHIFSEHFFEHLFFDEAVALFAESHRVLKHGGTIRVVVPDADLRTYEPPEPIGYPSTRMPFTAAPKHKTRWSVYMLCEALRFTGFSAVPIHYCDRDGKYVRENGADLSCVQRKNSLIVDGLKH